MPTLVIVIAVLLAANVAYSGRIAYRTARNMDGGGYPTLTHVFVSLVLGLVAVGVTINHQGFGWLAGVLLGGIVLVVAAHVALLGGCTRWGEHRRGARRRAAASLSEIRLTPTD
jgi:uncharacterized membrane protein YidH (DUF202 family)